MSHPRKSAPESLKTRLCVLRGLCVNSRCIHEALELKSRRLWRQRRPFTPAENQANPEGPLFRGTFWGNFCQPVFGVTISGVGVAAPRHNITQGLTIEEMLGFGMLIRRVDLISLL
jgi:hypothetical protein